MTHPPTIISVIASEKTYAQDAVDKLKIYIDDAGLAVWPISWSVSGRAADIIVSQGDPMPHYEALRACAGDADIIMQPEVGRTKRLLICDMDSTMIEQECIDEMADILGLKEKVSAITEAAMRGELAFDAALQERVMLLKGLQESRLQEVYDKHITFTPGARALVQAMRDSGAYCMLVSGGFTFFTQRVAEALGFHEHHANHLEVEKGLLTGRVSAPILGKEAKVEAMEAVSAQKNIKPLEILAIGDGANDIPMLTAAGLGVAYKAKPAVRAAVHAQINHTDLSALKWVAGLGE